MIHIDDIIDIAEAIGNQLLILRERNGMDMSKNISVHLSMGKENMNELERGLYVNKHGNDQGFIPSDGELKLTIEHINFIIREISEDENDGSSNISIIEKPSKIKYVDKLKSFFHKIK